MNKCRKCIVGSILLVCMATLVVLAMHLFALHNEKEFATRILIRERGMYTLAGSKPITYCSIHHEAPEVKLVKQVPEGAIIEKPGPELKLTRTNFGYKDPMPIWSKWKKYHQLNNDNFCLAIQPGTDCTALFFINKTLLKQALTEHYTVFVTRIGKDFDIEKVVADIENQQSLFWTEIFKSDVARGLLFGYGLENSLTFQKGSDQKFQGYPDIYSCPIAEDLNVLFMKEVTIEELPLPGFRIFSEPDPQVEKYKKERAAIQAKYKDANLGKLFTSIFKRKLW